MKIKNQILLSIVTPTHNSQHTIKNLLLSIDNSAFNDFNKIETVIVDDCSTDHTINTINTLIPNLKCKTRLIQLKKNLGPAKARNTGVKNAQGTYVLFLDSDVTLYKKTLSNAFKHVQQNKIKAFTGLWDYHQKTKKFFPQFKALRDWSYWIIERNRGWRYYLFSTRIAGIEKKLFNDIGGFNEHFPEATVEDIELTYRIEKKTKIKFDSQLMVKHEFEDFWPIAKKYFKRARDWMPLYKKRLRFDPVATTQKEALKPIMATCLMGSLFLIPFISYFAYVSLLVFILYGFLERYFWFFLLKKKGLLFLVKSIPVAIMLYVIINLGAVYGYFKYPNGF